MIDVKDVEVRLAEHQIRIDRTNREAWKWHASDSTETPRIRKISIGVAAIRRHAGKAIVRAGYRLLPAHPGTEARS